MKYLFDNKFGFIFAFIGILLQIVAFIYTDASWLSLISGISGILAVVLCAERKMSFWIFLWIQLITYTILVVDQKLWGEVGEYIFYGITMILGMFIWNKYQENYKVKSRILSNNSLTLLMIFCCLGTILLYSYLLTTNDTQPFIDSISTVPAIFAQFLMILAYREQWYFWLTIDIASVIMWWIIGDWCMTSQFIFWTINCIYGLKKWKIYSST